MHALKASIVRAARRLCCRILTHPYKALTPDVNDLWLSGDLKERDEIRICPRCLSVTRRRIHG